MVGYISRSLALSFILGGSNLPVAVQLTFDRAPTHSLQKTRRKDGNSDLHGIINKVTCYSNNTRYKVITNGL